MMGYEGFYIRKRNAVEYGIEIHLEIPTCEISLKQMI